MALGSMRGYMSWWEIDQLAPLGMHEDDEEEDEVFVVASKGFLDDDP